MVTILRDVDAKLVEVADALARADDPRTRALLDETWAAIDALSAAIRMLAARAEGPRKRGRPGKDEWMRILNNGTETREDVALYIIGRLDEAETLLELARDGKAPVGQLVKTAGCLIESVRTLSERVQAMENQG
jgi:hypothetical protein